MGPKDIEEKLMKALKELTEKTSIYNAVVVDKNGLPITSYDKSKQTAMENEVEILAAGISSSILSLSKNINDMMRIDHGELQQMLIENKKGKTLICEAGPNSLIICNLAADASLGITLLALKKAAKDIGKLPIGPKEVKKIPADFDFSIPTID